MNPYIKPGENWRPVVGTRGKVGSWREVARLFSKRDGVWVETSTGKIDPFNAALKLVGLDAVESLDQVLSNSESCTALAGNSDAVSIMSANYKSEMSERNTSNYTSGLNLLCFKCKAKTYLLKGQNQCTEITSSWKNLEPYDPNTYFGYGLDVDAYSEPVYTGSIDFSGFSACEFKYANLVWRGSASENFKVGTASNTTDENYVDCKHVTNTTTATTGAMSFPLDNSQGIYVFKMTSYRTMYTVYFPEIYIY